MSEAVQGGSSDRARDAGVLHLASTFLASFPPTASPALERQLASLSRVREDGTLTIRVDRQGKRVTVLAVGELDIASARALEAELLDAIDSRPLAVVLDLSDISFIDSTGLRALFSAAKWSARNAVPLKMAGARGPVRGVIESSGLHRALPLAD
jgi:anti-anti-sigma factor